MLTCQVTSIICECLYELIYFKFQLAADQHFSQQAEVVMFPCNNVKGIFGREEKTSNLLY